MTARRESARRVSDCVTALLRDQPFSAASRSGFRSGRTRPARPWRATGGRSAIRPAGSRTRMRISSRPRSDAWCWPARSSTTRGGASGSLSVGSRPRSSSPTGSCAMRASSSRRTPRCGTASASSRPTTASPSRRKAAGRAATARHRQGTAAAQPVRNPTMMMTTAAAMTTTAAPTPMTATPPLTHPTTEILKPRAVRARNNPSDAPASCDPSGTGEVMDSPGAHRRRRRRRASAAPMFPPKSRPGTRPCTRPSTLPRRRARRQAPWKRPSATPTAAPSIGARYCAAT